MISSGCAGRPIGVPLPNCAARGIPPRRRTATGYERPLPGVKSLVAACTRGVRRCTAGVRQARSPADRPARSTRSNRRGSFPPYIGTPHADTWWIKLVWSWRKGSSCNRMQASCPSRIEAARERRKFRLTLPFDREKKSMRASMPYTIPANPTEPPCENPSGLLPSRSRYLRVGGVARKASAAHTLVQQAPCQQAWHWAAATRPCGAAQRH